MRTSEPPMKGVIALIAVLIAAVRVDAADWVRVETPNFVVFGEVGEKRTKAVAAEFERFKEAIAHVLPNAATTAAVPTTVVVFDSQRSFAPYLPRYNGKPVMLGGYFTTSESDNMIALTVENRDSALRIVFHEYTHLIVSAASRSLPAWVNEGIAEFYSTFAVAPDGKGGILGQVIPQHYVSLGQNELLPLEQLLTVDRSSPLYNEGQRRSIFYAQSWAMVHMFIAGEPNRSKEFGHYIQLVTGGAPAIDAWRQAFGDFDVIKELRRYLRSPTVRNFKFRFDERIATVAAVVSKPKPSDVAGVLAALLRYAVPDEMEPRLRGAVDMTPPSALARSLLGVVKVRSNQAADAVPLLFEAAAETSDWLVQYHVANGLTRIARSAGRQPDSKVVSTARAAIDVVLSARPQLAHALALKAQLQNDLEGAATAARARALAPGREDYIFLEARLRAEAGEFEVARNLLAVLLTPRFPPNVRENARSLMGQIVRREQASAGRTNPQPASAAAAPEPATSSMTPESVQPDFRALKTGEQRLEGALEKIECATNGTVTLVVRASGELKRFAAAAFSDIDFITYRPQSSDRINCGDRTPPDAVYVTWVPLNATPRGVTGKPVAVEFLPVK